MCISTAAVWFMLSKRQMVNNIIIDRTVYEACTAQAIKYEEGIDEVCDEVIRDYLKEVAEKNTQEVIDVTHMREFLKKNF